MPMLRKYEAAVFNEDVLNALQNGERHKDLSDDWADTHYFELKANTLQEAWSMANRKWRAEHGFVIKAIEEMDLD
ncbi:hypothetical protein [Sneathiella limimaris]|uniref:hypothetical protein n=1 Tax=Sneathiella limimaris TaxID=1964213 RepID=UPI00146A9531|nr:hypothetical protein [Sneathiella limimaris]